MVQEGNDFCCSSQMRASKSSLTKAAWMLWWERSLRRARSVASSCWMVFHVSCKLEASTSASHWPSHMCCVCLVSSSFTRPQRPGQCRQMRKRNADRSTSTFTCSSTDQSQDMILALVNFGASICFLASMGNSVYWRSAAGPFPARVACGAACGAADARHGPLCHAAHVCQGWEDGTRPQEQVDQRVHRHALLQSPECGAAQRDLPGLPFQQPDEVPPKNYCWRPVHSESRPFREMNLVGGGSYIQLCARGETGATDCHGSWRWHNVWKALTWEEDDNASCKHTWSSHSRWGIQIHRNGVGCERGHSQICCSEMLHLLDPTGTLIPWRKRNLCLAEEVLVIYLSISPLFFALWLIAPSNICENSLYASHPNCGLTSCDTPLKGANCSSVSLQVVPSSGCELSGPESGQHACARGWLNPQARLNLACLTGLGEQVAVCLRGGPVAGGCSVQVQPGDTHRDGSQQSVLQSCRCSAGAIPHCSAHGPPGPAGHCRRCPHHDGPRGYRQAQGAGRCAVNNFRVRRRMLQAVHGREQLKMGVFKL